MFTHQNGSKKVTLLLEIEVYEMQKYLSLMENSGAEAETVFSYMLSSLADNENNWSILEGEQLAADVSKGRIVKNNND